MKRYRPLQMKDNKYNIQLAKLEVEDARRRQVIEVAHNPRPGAYVESNINALIGALKSTTIINNNESIANRSGRYKRDASGMRSFMALATLASVARTPAAASQKRQINWPSVGVSTEQRSYRAMPAFQGASNCLVAAGAAVLATKASSGAIQSAAAVVTCLATSLKGAMARHLPEKCDDFKSLRYDPDLQARNYLGNRPEKVARENAKMLCIAKGNPCDIRNTCEKTELLIDHLEDYTTMLSLALETENTLREHGIVEHAFQYENENYFVCTRYSESWKHTIDQIFLQKNEIIKRIQNGEDIDYDSAKRCKLKVIKVPNRIPEVVPEFNHRLCITFNREMLMGNQGHQCTTDNLDFVLCTNERNGQKLEVAAFEVFQLLGNARTGNEFGQKTPRLIEILQRFQTTMLVKDTKYTDFLKRELIANNIDCILVAKYLRFADMFGIERVDEKCLSVNEYLGKLENIKDEHLRKKMLAIKDIARNKYNDFHGKSWRSAATIVIAGLADCMRRHDSNNIIMKDAQVFFDNGMLTILVGQIDDNGQINGNAILLMSSASGHYACDLLNIPKVANFGTKIGETNGKRDHTWQCKEGAIKPINNMIKQAFRDFHLNILKHYGYSRGLDPNGSDSLFDKIKKIIPEPTRDIIAEIGLILLKAIPLVDGVLSIIEEDYGNAAISVIGDATLVIGRIRTALRLIKGGKNIVNARGKIDSYLKGLEKVLGSKEGISFVVVNKHIIHFSFGGNVIESPASLLEAYLPNVFFSKLSSIGVRAAGAVTVNGRQYYSPPEYKFSLDDVTRLLQMTPDVKDALEVLQAGAAMKKK